QRLQEAQIYIGSAKLSQETDENEIIKLHPVMRSLIASLQINSDSISNKE
ncbi:34017_t:CDS:2, partial [Gigaspora margarita]